MKPVTSPPLADASAEISTLIETLLQTEQRLEELTSGEVDTVTDRTGRTFLMHRAQIHSRHNEAARQAAILNALPLNIALIDAHGRIISIDEAWRRFAIANNLKSTFFGIGLNYLEVCDSARGEDAGEARQAAAGIRAVLDSTAKSFSMVYSCHSPTEQRWFQLMVTPLTDDSPDGAVVMHLSITEQKLAGESLRESEQKLRAIFDGALDGILVTDIESGKFLTGNPAICSMLGYTGEELTRIGISDIHLKQDMPFISGLITTILSGEAPAPTNIRVLRKNGSVFYADIKGTPISIGGKECLLGVFRDITERIQTEQKLHESERRFSSMLDNVELISMMLDRDAHITYCNEYLLRLSGWRSDEIIGKKWFEIFVPTELIDLRSSFFAALLTDQPETWHHENEILTRSGEHRLIRWNNSVLRSGSGDVIGTASIGEDITERREAEARIVYLNRIYAVLSGINTLIVRVHDQDDLFREACRIAVEEGGFRMSLIALVDQTTGMVVPVASAGKDERLLKAITSILSSSEQAPATLIAQAIREKQVVVANDSQNDPRVVLIKEYTESGVCSMAIFPLIVAGEVRGIVAIYASEIDFFHEDEMKLLTELTGDISFALDHIARLERLDYLAYYDELTGLANRTLFLDRVTQYIRSAVSGRHQLALYLFDLERFKNINDSLGQPAGDELLKQVAEWLKGTVGDANCLARLGADHFAVILPEVRQESDVARLLEKKMQAFQEHPFRLNDTVLRISFKAGVALYPDDGDDAGTLFRRAEAALKKAKERGDHYLFYNRKMSEASTGKLTLEYKLRQALDREEFVLHYQPKVNIASGAVTSAEALIRWNDPLTGLVPPGRFIPILEETGLIYEVGRWSLNKAIADYLRWRAAGLAVVPIAVNVSPLQLRHPGFIAEIKRAVGVDSCAAAGVELEITESLIMEDVEYSIANLRIIRDMGIRIAIDDFGTGFSSLSYLSKLPVDTLKIDRSFIIDMTEGPEGLSLVSTIINLAHSLKLKVVAEGVETEEQWRLLRLLNCDEIQGFLFSKPLPGEEFESKFLIAPG